MILNDEYSFFACPNCGHPKKIMTMISGNTCWASYWSDGVTLYPMFLSFPDVLKCKKCSSFFWFDDIVEIDVREFSKLGIELSRIADIVKKLSVYEYYEAIESNLCSTPEIEKKLRIAAWRRWNDTLRGNGDKTIFTIPKRVQHWRFNLNTLLNLLDESKEEECLIKAEILRNLRRYREAKAILLKVKNDKKQKFINKLICLCEQKEWEVKKIK